MLARIQQFLVLSVLACAVSWLAVFWKHSALAALVGFCFILLLYCGALALQFVWLTNINRHDPAPRPSSGQLVRAWLVETIAAARVFYWWQPFRSNAISDLTRILADGECQRGVVLLHGFVCNRGLWTLWLRVLRHRGIPFVAVNLEPVFASIDAYVPMVERAIVEISRTTGKPPLLVCHSMGGLVARAWLRAGAGDDRVHQIVTIGSPHHGTAIGNLGSISHFVVNGQQMRFHSHWLRELARQESPGRTKRFTCFYSNCDNIVMPATSATLTGADNRLVPGVPHLALVLDATVMEQSLAML